MTELYSPLRYPGGKARLARFLVEAIRQNGLREPLYAEPYAGGAGAALHLLFEEHVESIMINDADPRIWAFWHAITHQTEEFIDRIQNVDITVSEWHYQRRIYSDCDTTNPIDLGFSTFFLNRTSRSGVIHNGGPIGGYAQKGNYKVDARFKRTTLVRRAARIGSYSDRIEITSKDGLAFLKHLNRRVGVAKQSFVYLDPPYYVKSSGLYLNRFTHYDHRRLALYLRSRKNFQWIMTYDNVQAIRDLYKQFPMTAFSLSYSAYERRGGNELLIRPGSILLNDYVESHLPCAG